MADKRNTTGRPRRVPANGHGGGTSNCQLFLVGRAAEWNRWTNKSRALKGCLLQSGEDVRRWFVRSSRDSVWVTRDISPLTALARDSVQGSGDRRLLVMGAMDEITHQVLASWFRYVVVGMDSRSLLESSELIEVLQASNRSDLFIGGAYDSKDRVVVLYRGSVQPLVIPLDWFKSSAVAVQPDPKRLQVIDYGQTVKLGDFEAAADAILYEFDEEYRRKAKKQFIEVDTSLGGAIRRLRLQRGLTRGGFAPVPIRTIARIERGEVRRPQRATLKKIAERLGVSVESLGSY